MAINKVVNNGGCSHGAMRNAMEYVLRDNSLEEEYIEITGPYNGETINYDEVYQTWLAEKRMWDKDSGRMYAHNIIRFHKDEQITPEQVLEISRQFVDRFFPDHQSLIAVHQDKEHLHCHILTNSVSYVDGHKLHQTKHDLQLQKDFTNELCRDQGLSVTEKGHHFDGSLIEQGEITAWSKDKYNLLINNTKDSFVADCALAIMSVMSGGCCSRDDFISEMAQQGWEVQWMDNRKHIVFENENGDKVRDSRIENTFAGLEVNKEALNHEFERQNQLRLEQLAAEQQLEEARRLEEEREYAEYEQYIAEIEAAVAGHNNEEAVRDDSATYHREHDLKETDHGKERREPGHGTDDIRSFLADIDAQEKGARSEARNSGLKRKEREAEQQRLAIKRSQEHERASRARHARSHNIGLGL